MRNRLWVWAIGRSSPVYLNHHCIPKIRYARRRINVEYPKIFDCECIHFAFLGQLLQRFGGQHARAVETGPPLVVSPMRLPSSKFDLANTSCVSTPRFDSAIPFASSFHALLLQGSSLYGVSIYYCSINLRITKLVFGIFISGSHSLEGY